MHLGSIRRRGSSPELRVRPWSTSEGIEGLNFEPILVPWVTTRRGFSVAHVRGMLVWRRRRVDIEQGRVVSGAIAARIYVGDAVNLPQVIEEVGIVDGGVTAVQIFRAYQRVVMPQRFRPARTSVYICVQLG